MKGENHPEKIVPATNLARTTTAFVAFFVAIFPMFAVFVGIATNETWLELAINMASSGLQVPTLALTFLDNQQAILWGLLILGFLNFAGTVVWLFKNRRCEQVVGVMRLMAALIFSALITVFYLAMLAFTAAILIAPLFR